MFLALNLVFEAVSPSVAMALTGGPSQPEVQSFTPVSTSDMVNLFSGDFNYNIPLMDVDGYPINLAYNAGIGNDQEAGWVGLGWNINPGTVNRGMRGLPDDFKGDVIHREINMKPNQTFGASFGLGLELFGKDAKAGGKQQGTGYGNLSLSLGLNYNTYAGYGMDMGARVSLSQSKNNKDGWNGSLGLNSGTGKGLGISANVGYQKMINDKSQANRTITGRKNASLGLSYNTASGLNSLTFDYSFSKNKQTVTWSSTDMVTLPTVENKGGSTNGGFGYSFASPTYMPSSGVEMVNVGLNLSVTFGFAAFGQHPKGTIGAYYSGQFVKDKTRDLEAYGYLNSELNNSFADPENSSNKLHDFNREKDASFTLNTPNLPVTNYTYDSYAYTGQGISGDFRPHRNHVGMVFDPYTKNFPSMNGSVGVELGAGGIAHGGLNVDLSFSRTTTGKWTKRNNAEGKALFSGGNQVFNESVYFKQGGEKTAETDMNYFNNVINGFTPVRMGLQKSGAEAFLTNDLTTKYGATKPLLVNSRLARVRRNESVSVLTAAQASIMGLETSIKSYSINTFSSFYSAAGQPSVIPRVGGNKLNHHISEITTLRDDGARYTYGIPAYNNLSKDVTFAVEPGAITYSTGLISYSGSDNSTSNTRGLDNYYDSQSMPPYAHAFLLTAVLSPDYVDRTQNGPTRDDLGKYTKFNYTRLAETYKWRNPFGSNSASLNQALYSSTGAGGDDKASYTYGEKELWYLHSIETKNYVAVFELDNRQDAYGVAGENGGIDVGQKQKQLKEIRLYTRQELTDRQANAVPLKVVHFEYDHSLCPGVSNNGGGPLGTGKLTLKKVWFTYQASQKGRLSPYEFSYNTANAVTNYPYNSKAYDRWGNYKENLPPGGYNPNSSGTTYLTTSEFPYSEQDPATANLYASAWNLSRIKLPSGAEINITYEADDYAYVQDKKAMQMFTIQGADISSGGANNSNPGSILYDTSPVTFYDLTYVNLSASDLQAVASTATLLNITQNEAARRMFLTDENGVPIQHMYFKYLVNVERNLNPYTPKFEYISGYAKIDFSTPPVIYNNRLVFKVKTVDLYDNIASNQSMHPVSMAGINFVRRYMPRVAYDNNQDPFSSVGSNLLALAQGMKAAFTPIVQFFKGGMSNALRLSHACQQFVPQRSFVRLYSGKQFKKGGGCRVKQVQLSDNWSAQSGNIPASTSTYGQIYDYVTKDPNGRTISSGVASYEPMIGGEENPFRQPLFYEEKHILAPDDDFYHETPYGESMFPGASVGYSRVVVRNLERTVGAPVTQQVSRHATGAVVSEFYTAKDFPTKTDRTDVKKERHKPNPVLKFLKFSTRDFMTTSQGYQVIANDMHGKPKASWVYKEANPTALANGRALDEYYGNNYISGVEYKYRRNLDQLDNNVQVIEKTGQISTAMVGVDYDMVLDTRESQTVTRNGTLQGNLEGFLLAIFPALVPTIFPGYSQEKTRYRSAVVTKVLYRYGLLEETIAHENGASVSTKNTLWDAETGEVLLTQTTNSHNDPVYNLSYPAHWAYDRMGSASKNGAAVSNILAGNIVSPNILIIGDEVLLNGSGSARGWVKAVLPAVQIIDNTGAVLNLSGYSSLTVVRSGNRNQQNVPVGGIVSLQNPIITNAGVPTLMVDKYSKVVSAGATDYKDGWGIFCNCSVTGIDPVNPFLTGQMGTFRPESDYAYLTSREQTRKNDNTNLRKDGPYTTFAAFWSPNAAAPYNWTKTTDPAWQYITRSTLYSPYGFELENKDALNKNSAAQYGYGNTLPVAVSSNAKYSQMGFDGFEDYDYNAACENHFGYIQYFNGSGMVTYDKQNNNYVSKANSQNQTFSHTGRKSIKVPYSTTVRFTVPLQQNTCNPSPNAPLIY